MLFEDKIKTSLKKAGLSEDLADQIQVGSEGEIEEAVAKLKITRKTTNLTKKEFLEIIKEAGVMDSLEDFVNSEVDRKLSKAIQEHDKNLQKKAEEEKAKLLEEEKKKGQETMSEEQKKIQMLEDRIANYEEKFNGLEGKLSEKDLNTQIRESLKKVGLSEEFATHIKVTSPGEIETKVGELKTLLTQTTQDVINKQLEAGDLAHVKKGEPGATLEESQIKEYAQSKGKAGSAVKNSPFTGALSSHKAVLNADKE